MRGFSPLLLRSFSPCTRTTPILVSISPKVTQQSKSAKTFALAIVAVAVLAAPIFVGLINAPSIRAQSVARPQFEVISIKPDRSESGNVSMGYQAGRFTVRNFSLKRLINNAYHPLKIVGDPSWITSEKYDIDAK